MTINLDSNFFILGSHDLTKIELQESLTLKDLLQELSRLSPDSPEYVMPGGETLSPGWTVQINGNILGFNNAGLDTALRDGDRVSINLDLICGG
jgi:hypothetical protein